MSNDAWIWKGHAKLEVCICCKAMRSAGHYGDCELSALLRHADRAAAFGEILEARRRWGGVGSHDVGFMADVLRITLPFQRADKLEASKPAKERCLDPSVSGTCQRGVGHDGGHCSYDIDDQMVEHERPPVGGKP